MKRIYPILAACLLSISVFSQVSDSQIKADIKTKSPSTISIKLDNPITEKEYEDGAWVYYYRRMYHSVETTKYTGVNYNYYGGAQYIKSGGAYRFDRLTIGDGYYDGFADPDLEKIKNYISQNGLEFFGHYYSKIVGEMPEIKLVPETNWKWHTPKSVSGLVTATFTVPTNYTTLEKATHTFEVRFYSDGEIAIDPNTSWKSISVSEKSQEKQVISTSTHTADEIRAMPSLSDIADQQRAEAELASLPKIEEIPVFASSDELFTYVHNTILTKSSDELKVYLYNLLAESCRTGKAINLVNESTQVWINKICDNNEVYKNTHCVNPTIKHKQSGMIEFWDKEETRKVRMNATQEDGTWKLYIIEYFPANKEDEERMAKNTSACEANAPAEMKEYSISKAGFSVIMPKEPKISEPGTNGNQYSMSCEHDGSEYLVTAEPLDEATVNALAEAGTYQGTVINWGDSFRKALGAASTQPYNWEVNGTKGIQTEWRTSSSVYRYRSVILDDMYYRIVVSNAKNTEEENAFFDSFKSTKENPNSSDNQLDIGDKVYVNTTKGKMKATITDEKDDKYEIKYSNPKYGKQWVVKTNVTKQ